MLISLNWLKEFVDIRLGPKELAERLTMAGFEVESVAESGGDAIFDINVMPNRGDCLSIIGMAREVAAITGRKIPNDKFQVPNKSQISNSKLRMKDFIVVEVKDKTRCHRYAARVIEGVKILPSPEWMVKRLESCGVRSVNNIVDATNYLMLETGQPFHAFDHRDIKGKKIIIDSAKSPIEFETLDGAKQKIVKDDLLICDANGPIAIAGIMGGANSLVKSDTTTIVLESACFAPTSVRRTSKRLGLASESSRRFERGIDGTNTLMHLNSLAGLILKIAGGELISDWVDIYPQRPKVRKIKVSLNEINNLLGTDIKEGSLKKYFNSLGISYKGNICTVPPWRVDILRSADLIEEAARLNGYDKIPAVLPNLKMAKVKSPESRLFDDKVREFFVANGFFEAINYGFCSPTELSVFYKGDPVKISNPLGVEFSAMKTTLLPGLLNNLKFNINFRQDNLRFFELRPVFLPLDGKTVEERKLSGVLYGNRSMLSWTARTEWVDFYDVKGVCEMLGSFLGLDRVRFEGAADYDFLNPSASTIIYNGKDKIGFCGLLHPKVSAMWDIKGDVYIFELEWQKWVDGALRQKRFYRPVERFPSVRRDVALLISEEITSEVILSAIKEFKSPIVKDAVPFDVYKGKGIADGKKSMAYAIMYASSERTLVDEDVNDAHGRLISYLKDKLGAEIR